VKGFDMGSVRREIKIERGSAKIYLIPASIAAICAGAYLLRRPRERRSLAGHVALITGGSRGLGLELARKLGQHQCRLILVARDTAELARAAQELSYAGTEVRTISCDLTKPEEIGHMVEEAKAAFGRLDILINNAGEITVGPIDVLHEAEFHRAMDLMFWAGVRTTLAFLPQLTSSGDSDIVNITSIGGKIAVPHLLPYVAAKFAMTGFSEGLQSEVRRRGVHVLTVTPGLMRTGGHLNAEFAGDQKREYRWFALGATMPGLSMDVSRAANQIVEALIDRKREIVLTVMAQTAARVYGALPATALKALELVDRWILPSPAGDESRKKGHELHNEQPYAFRALTRFGTKAAESHNQM
jgi:short-subunit dehydrogenase